jgi:hypothetical protein
MQLMAGARADYRLRALSEDACRGSGRSPATRGRWLLLQPGAGKLPDENRFKDR